MTFTPEQKEALSAKLDRAHVRERKQAGRTLSYLEGWWCIAEANRIFGFDGWSSKTVEVKCVAERERSIGRDGEVGWGVSYIAKVIVEVSDPDFMGALTREGIGAGHGIDRDLGLAHESAIKEAETDARKRALMTFGNPFGLALYDKTQENVENAPQRPAEPAREPSAVKRLTSSRAKEIGLDERLKALVDGCKDEAAVDMLESQFDKVTEEAPLSWLDSYRNRIILRREELVAEAAHRELDDEYRAVMA